MHTSASGWRVVGGVWCVVCGVWRVRLVAYFRALSKFFWNHWMVCAIPARYRRTWIGTALD